jgi:hypothetical protein
MQQLYGVNTVFLATQDERIVQAAKAYSADLRVLTLDFDRKKLTGAAARKVPVFVYVYICLYMRVCMCVCVYVYVYVYIYIYMQPLSRCVYECMLICTNVCLYVRMYAYMYECMLICTNVCFL